MASDIQIDVTVHISDALKDMFGYRTDPVTVPDAIPAPRGAQRTADWQLVSLRRDGQRPLVFVGLPLLDRRCVTDSPAPRCEQALTFYMAQDGTLYARLAFEPSESCPAWPSYRGEPIHDPGDLAALLRKWQPEQCFDKALYDTDTPLTQGSAGPVAARSAFNSMAADCLTLAVLQG
jgi:hypothetical protein